MPGDAVELILPGDDALAEQARGNLDALHLVAGVMDWEALAWREVEAALAPDRRHEILDPARLVEIETAQAHQLEHIADASGPLLITGGTGVDVAGWACALLLLIANVPLDIIVKDFMLTDAWRSTGVDPSGLFVNGLVQRMFL